MDAITLLKDDHRTVEELFKRFERAGDAAHAEKRELVGRIIEALSKHATIEEQLFYPVTRETVPEVRDLALESLEEHHVVKWVLSELDGMDPAAERYDAKVTVLIETVRHHVEEEESDYFPKVRDELGATALERLGDALQSAKQSAPTHPHPRSPDTPPGNIVAGAGAAVVDRVTDTVAGVAQGSVSAIADLIEAVTGAKVPRPASPPAAPDARKVADRVRQDVADAADRAGAVAGQARRAGEQTTRAVAGAVRETADDAVDAARQTGSTAVAGAKATGRTAQRSARSGIHREAVGEEGVLDGEEVSQEDDVDGEEVGEAKRVGGEEVGIDREAVGLDDQEDLIAGQEGVLDGEEVGQEVAYDGEDGGQEVLVDREEVGEEVLVDGEEVGKEGVLDGEDGGQEVLVVREEVDEEGLLHDEEDGEEVLVHDEEVDKARRRSRQPGSALSPVAAIVIGVITAVVVVAAAVMLLRGGNPEATASHSEDLGEENTPSWDLYRGSDRPAGPDVESTADPAVPPTLPADDWDRHDGRTP